ncbi:MAG TPA: BadF/BadG/BcrA/BcrD ATPase family protein, partial [Bacillota bacterium]|nr:BadF/BadG/BcrA/BcrD ATPase family protein [Bacillota bacterium]
MDEMAQTGTKWKENITISSMCGIFAESEVVSLIAENKNTADIIHGLNKSVASKTVSLLSRIPVREKIMITGGVA